ncbi:MAG: hypothetical protein WBA72_01490 [Ornithinimicrobium sp.]
MSIANRSSIVEGYRLSVIDDRAVRGIDAGPADWAAVLAPDAAAGTHGAHISVYPQQQQSVVLVFSVPTEGRAEGGSWAFAIKAQSVVDEDARAVAEGDLDVGHVLSATGKLTPVNSAGRWRGLHVVQLSNWGNTPRRLHLSGHDPDEALGFLIRPETVELPVGGTATARLNVRARKPRLRGTVARLPFTIKGTEGRPVEGEVERPRLPGASPGMPSSVDSGNVEVAGAFTQKPILTRALVTGMILLVALLIGAVALALSRHQDVDTYERLSTPPTPELSAQANGPGSILLSWAPVDRIEKYELDHLQGDSEVSILNEDLDAALGAYPVEGLKADSELCFTLTAVRGEATSPPSERACAQTEPDEGPDPSDQTAEITTDDGAAAPSETITTAEPAQETDTATSTDQPTNESGETALTPAPPAGSTEGEPAATAQSGISPGEWVAQLRIFPEASGGLARAEEDAIALQADGVPALLLFSADFSTLTPPLAEPSWVVYVDEDYDNRESAMDGCRSVRESSDVVNFCDPPLQPIAP